MCIIGKIVFTVFTVSQEKLFSRFSSTKLKAFSPIFWNKCLQFFQLILYLFYRPSKTLLMTQMKLWWKLSRRGLIWPMIHQCPMLKKCKNGKFYAKIFLFLEVNSDQLWKWKGILCFNNMQIWSMDFMSNILNYGFLNMMNFTWWYVTICRQASN